jgi:hypothetical protein
VQSLRRAPFVMTLKYLASLESLARIVRLLIRLT